MDQDENGFDKINQFTDIDEYFINLLHYSIFPVYLRSNYSILYEDL
jgi:hypothetical protein